MSVERVHVRMDFDLHRPAEQVSESAPTSPEQSSQYTQIFSPANQFQHYPQQTANYYLAQFTPSVPLPQFTPPVSIPAANQFHHPKPSTKEKRRMEETPIGEDWASTQSHGLLSEDDEMDTVADYLDSSSFAGYRDSSRNSRSSSRNPEASNSSKQKPNKRRSFQPSHLQEEADYWKDKARYNRDMASYKLAQERERSDSLKLQLQEVEKKFADFQRAAAQSEQSQMQRVMEEYDRRFAEATAATEQRLAQRLEKLESENEARIVAQGIRHARTTTISVPAPSSGSLSQDSGSQQPNTTQASQSVATPNLYSRSAWRKTPNRHHTLLSTAALQSPRLEPAPSTPRGGLGSSSARGGLDATTPPHGLLPPAFIQSRREPRPSVRRVGFDLPSPSPTRPQREREPGPSTHRAEFNLPSPTPFLPRRESRPSAPFAFSSSPGSLLRPVTPEDQPLNLFLTRQEFKQELDEFKQSLLDVLRGRHGGPSSRRSRTRSRGRSGSRQLSTTECESSTDGDDEHEPGPRKGKRREPYTKHNKFNKLTRYMFHTIFNIKNDIDVKDYISADHAAVVADTLLFNKDNLVLDFVATATAPWNLQVFEALVERGNDLRRTLPEFSHLHANKEELTDAIVGKFIRVRRVWLSTRATMKDDGTVETPAEVEGRLLGKLDHDSKRSRHYQRRRDRYHRRIRIISHQISTAGQNQNSKATWEWLLRLIETLGTDGMSSDETDKDSNALNPRRFAKKLPWRRDLEQFLVTVDGIRGDGGDGFGTQGQMPTIPVRGHGRILITEVRIVYGLPQNLYDQAWLEERGTNFVRTVVKPSTRAFPEIDVFFDQTT